MLSQLSFKSTWSSMLQASGLHLRVSMKAPLLLQRTPHTHRSSARCGRQEAACLGHAGAGSM